MAEEKTTPVSTEPSDSKGTSIDKFTSAEERDKAYLELENLTRTQAESLATLEKRFDAMDVAPAPTTDPEVVDNPLTDYQPIATEDAQKQAALTAFYADPIGVMTQISNSTRQQTLADVKKVLSAKDMIDTYFVENPDLRPHQDLINFYYNKTPASKTPNDRLAQAGKEVRKFVTQNRKTEGKQPDPNSFVEDPSRETVAAPVAPAAVIETPETILAEYVKERAIDQNKRARPPSRAK